MDARSTLIEFWRRLDGNVHPDDADVLGRGHHTLNFDYPPPAFMGDLRKASVVVLMANGGYSPTRTPEEFSGPDAQDVYRQHLRGELPGGPPLADYYRQGFWGGWLLSGSVAMVNALAYRSPSLSQEPENVRLADRLPSVRAHRQWATEELIPSAMQGERLVLVHRNGLWKLPRTLASANVIFSTNPVSKVPSASAAERVREWIDDSRSSA